MLSNFLLDKLPIKTPNNYEINTDFRQSIKFELLMQDTNIKEDEKPWLALNIYYKENIDNPEKQIEDIIWFYKGGREETLNQATKKSREKQIYSYKFDDNYIWSAFMQQYNIDLERIKYLHWWKFKALFENLNDNTKIVEIMGYRAMDLSKIKDKEQKKHYKKLKEIYALPDMRTQEQKEADFAIEFLK